MFDATSLCPGSSEVSLLGLPGMRVLAVHGRRDEGVLPDVARRSVEALAALGVPAEFREYDCGHPVLREDRCREDVRAFLAG